MPLTSSIKAKAIDAGQNFLTGQITSVFAASGMEIVGSNVAEIAENIQNKASAMVSDLENTATTMVSSAGAGLGSAFGNVVGASEAFAGEAMQMTDMAQEAIADVASYSLDLLNQKTSEIASTTTSYFMSRVKTWSAFYLQQGMNQIPKKFLQDAEEESKKTALEQQTKGPQKILDYVNTYVGLASSYVQKYTGEMNKFVEQQCTFALQGPQWLGGQINKLENQYKEGISGFVDTQAQNIIKNRNNFLDGIAKSVAKQTIQPTLKAINKKIDKLNNTTNKNEAKVKQAAATQIQKAKLKLAGLLGVKPF